jgi:hypothetical protein
MYFPEYFPKQFMQEKAGHIYQYTFSSCMFHLKLLADDAWKCKQNICDVLHLYLSKKHTGASCMYSHFKNGEAMHLTILSRSNNEAAC